MSEVDRQFKLLIDDLVSDDLKRVEQQDTYDHDQIVVFLQELKGNQILCEDLINEHHSDLTIQDIKPFWYLQNERLNVYRIKLCMVGAWRVLTAGDHRKKEVAILAVMHRDQDYEADPQLIERLRSSYERLGFNKLGE